MIEAAIAVAVALVCVLAAVAVFRVRVPLVLRLIAVLVLLYGASVAITVTGGGFAGALDGDPLPALPYWLRAAYLDGQLILPSIAVFSLIGALVALVRRRPRSALAAFVLSVGALGCAQLAAYAAGRHGLPTIVAFEGVQPATLSGAPCPDPTMNPLAGIEGYAPGAGSANQMGGSLGGMLGSGGDAAAGASPKPTAAPVLSCVVDPNVAELFDRLDDLDRKVPRDDARVSALAASLNGVDAAFAYVRDRIATESYPGAMRGAFGTLVARGGSSADKALLLAALLEAQHVPARFAHAALSDAEIDRVLRAPAPVPDAGDTAGGALDARAKADMAKVHAAQAAALDVAARSAAATVDDVFARVAAGGTRLGSDRTAQSRDAVRTHYWVQAQSGGGWIDLDPAFASVAKGTHLGRAATTTDGLPDDAYAALAVRVFADRTGSKGAAPVVDVSKHVAEVTAVPITIALVNREAKLKQLAEVKDVTASVSIAGSDTSSDAFPLNDLEAVRTEITLTQPGRVPRVYHRTLYRRVTGDARSVAAAATIAESMLVTTGDYDGAFVDRHEIDNLRAAKPVIVWATEHRQGRMPPPPAIAPEPFPIEAMRYVIADAQARARIAQTLAPGSRFVYDRPLIATVRRSLRTEGKALRGRVAFDIVENGMVLAGSDAQRDVRANAIRGAIDTNIEQHVVGAPAGSGTPAVFTAAKAAGVPLAVATSANAPQVDAALSADARAGIADTIALNEVAVVPQRPVDVAGGRHSGWWALDPAAGDLVGRMDDGEGQGEVEYVMARLNDDATLYTMIQFYADFFRCIAMGVEQPLSGSASDTKACMELALCNYLESLTFGFGIDSTLMAFVYNLMDITFYDNTPGLAWKTKSSGAGALCTKTFNFSF